MNYTGIEEIGRKTKMKFFNGFDFKANQLTGYKIISIDLGHGDTSASRISSDGKIYDLFVADGKTVIHTIVGYNKKGEPCIGDEVNIMPEVYPYFKERPDLLDEYMDDSDKTRKQLIGDFLKLLMDNIYKYNNPFVNRVDKILLLVGCPSDDDWNTLKYNYAKIISNATGIKCVAIIPESKAAIINALESDDQININDGVIVFDFGSLTSDCTYIIPKSKMVEDFSIPLGAAMIEKNMLKYALGSLPCSTLDSVNHTHIFLRNQKEDFYYGKYKSMLFGIEKADDPDNPIPITICNSLMDKVVKGKDSDGH
ncbi:MAG: hypothetical protein K0S55_549, partial [Clostridia bacterium]|nr:hypothetical protein [Clostridia bacterium]